MIFDNPISLFVSNFNHGFIGEMALNVSLIGNAEVIGILSLLVIGFFAVRKKYEQVLILTASVISTGAFVFVLKNSFARLRPDNALVIILNDPSFPSGHAAMSAAFFIALAYICSRSISGKSGKKIIIIGFSLLVLLIGISRVILNVHWASDVIVGWGIGTFFALISIRIAGYLVKTRSKH